MQKQHWTIAEIVLKNYWFVAELCLKYCWNIAGNLSELCWILKTVWNVPISDRFQNCIIRWKNTEILLKFLLIFCSALSEICLECSNFSQISDIEIREFSDNVQNKISRKFIYVSAKNLHEGWYKKKPTDCLENVYQTFKLFFYKEQKKLRFYGHFFKSVFKLIL